jgi:Fe-S-cluster containining protein
MTDKQAKPWYQAGLRFTCTRCGHCCSGEPGFVWVTDEDLAAIAAHQGESLETIRGLYTRWTTRGRTLREKGNGDCVFYDSRAGCTIYPARPPQCRTWPFWESNVETPQAWQRAGSGCPGCDKGDLIPAEEITKRLKVIRL